jgi:zinc transporter ZupT
MGGEVLGAALVLALDASLSPDGAVGVLAFVAGIMVSLSLTQLVPAGLALMRPDQHLGLAEGEPVAVPER